MEYVLWFFANKLLINIIKKLIITIKIGTVKNLEIIFYTTRSKKSKHKYYNTLIKIKNLNRL